MTNSFDPTDAIVSLLGMIQRVEVTEHDGRVCVTCYQDFGDPETLVLGPADSVTAKAALLWWDEEQAMGEKPVA